MADEIFRTLAVAFAFSLLGLSVYLACRVLRVIDFTCDASVSIGGCVYAAAAAYGMHPVLAAAVCTLLGACAGFVTASLSSNLSVKTSIASIITLIMSQIFVFKVCLLREAHAGMCAPAAECSVLTLCAAAAIISIVVYLLFYRIINSEYGLTMRIYREGPIVSESLGINRANILTAGLGLSNALAALSGAFVMQISKTCSPAMGIGSFVFGLGVILLIEKSSSHMSFKKSIGTCALAAFFYKIVIDILARCIGGAAPGALPEYERVVSGAALIMLTALTFSGKAPKKSVIHV